MNFVNTDFICLVTAQMSYWLIKCKKFTQKVMHTFRKKKALYALYDNRLHQLLQIGAVFVLYAAKKTPQKMGQV